MTVAEPIMHADRVIIKTSVRIFDVTQREYLEACLRSFKHHNLFAIESTSARDADVVFICPTEPGAVNQIDALTHDMGKIVVVYTNNNLSSSPWSIERPAKKETLDDLFCQLLPILKSNHEQTLSPINPQPGNNELNIATEVMSKYHHFESQKKFLEVELKGKLFYFDTERKFFLSSNSEDSTALISEKMSHIKPIKKLPEGLKEVSTLNESKWNSLRHYILSNDLKLTFNNNRQYSLTRWPNFKNLLHNYHDILLASFFLRYNATANDAAQKLNLDIKDVDNFCLTAFLSGYLSEKAHHFKSACDTPYPVSKKMIHSIFKSLRKEAQ